MTEISIGNTTDGVVIEVKAFPNSPVTKLAGIHDRRLKIRVNAAPEDGKANKEIIAYLSKLFGCRKSEIEIIRGETSQEKVVLIKGKLLEVVENIITENLS